MTLLNTIQTLPKNQLIAVGASSAYFYIGQAGRFAERYCLGNTSPVSDRKILRKYQQTASDYAMVLIVDGRDGGKFWTKSECDEATHLKDQSFFCT